MLSGKTLEARTVRPPSARPIAKWNTTRDCWETDQVDMLSGRSVVYSETFMTSGSMRNGVVYAHPMSGHLMDGSGSLFSQLGGKILPTPRAADHTHSMTAPAARAHVAAGMGALAEVVGVQLLPSPVAQPSGNTPADHLRKKPGREVVTDLAIIVENGLLKTGGRLPPTPRLNEANGAGVHGDGGTDLRTTVAMLPTPRATRGGSATEMAYGFGGERSDEHRQQGTVELPESTSWGPYASAIERWERMLGRRAPEPTEVGPKGGRRLAARFVEWLMGLPFGWVTALALGLSRTQQLKMLGNGVVTQQAVAALESMLPLSCTQLVSLARYGVTGDHLKGETRWLTTDAVVGSQSRIYPQ